MQGQIDVLMLKRCGCKVAVSLLTREICTLRAANARLTKRPEQAELIIDDQKQVAALLGKLIPTIRIDEEN